MRVSVWGINYSPELTGIAVYNTDLCEYLTESGDQIVMVSSFPYYPLWRKSSQDARCIYRRDYVREVVVERCWTFVPAVPTVFKRIIHEASFGVTSWLRQLFLPAPDIYIVISPPLALGLAAWSISRIKKAPFVFHVQDLQPDAALNLKMLRSNWLTNLLFQLEKLSYDKASLVSGISERMCRAIIDKGVSSNKVAYFPNWTSRPDQATLPDRGTWKRQKGLSESTRIVAYAGNLGVKQHIELIAAAAELLKQEKNILFVIVGNGAKRFELERYVARAGNSNMLLLDVLPEHEHTALLIDSDICLVTQQPGSQAAFLPSKLLKMLALGRPVLTNAEENSPLGDAVKEGQFGRLVDPLDATSLAGAIAELIADEPERKQMGESGRRFVTRFEREQVLSSYRKRLKRLVEISESRDKP